MQFIVITYLLDHIFTNIQTPIELRFVYTQIASTNSYKIWYQFTEAYKTEYTCIDLIDLSYACVGGWTSSWLSPGTTTAATVAPQILAGPPSTLGSHSA